MTTIAGAAGALVIIDGATRFLSMAALAIEAGDPAARTRHVDQVLRLLSSLRTRARQLGDDRADLVSRECALRVTDAGVRLDAASLRSCGDDLRALRPGLSKREAPITPPDTDRSAP